jgi:hypothetical protein
MAITTYAELQESIGDWLNRNDLTSVIPSFIDNAEARINRRLRTRSMETSTSLSLNASGEATLPADFLEARLVTVATTPVSFPEYVEPDSPEFLYKHRPNQNPQYYSVIGTTIKVQPAYNGSATLYYYGKLTALADDNTTNWLLTKAPDIYLYASCLEGAMYLKDAESAANYTDLFVAAVNDLMVEERAHVGSRQPLTPNTPSGKTMDLEK